jgi:hypothetical protein
MALMRRRSGKLTAGGVLSIIAGAVSVILGIVVAVGGTMEGVPLITGAVVAPLIILGVIAIVGGVYALKVKSWGLALAGAICAFFCVWWLGIPAIILTALSRRDFS